GCPLEGTIEQNLPCPQNGLVSFTGPGEIRSGTGKAASNSSYVVVQGVAQPTTAVTVTPSFTQGSTVWTNGSPSATFTGTPGATSPTLAPVKFIEWGINPAANGLPSTFPIPVASDNQVSNSPCNSTYPNTVSPLPTLSTGPQALGSLTG